jgi:hypothetical protein
MQNNVANSQRQSALVVHRVRVGRKKSSKAVKASLKNKAGAFSGLFL